MPGVKRRNLASALQSCRGQNQVIESNHLAGSFHLSPDARMFVSRPFCVRKDRQRSHYGSQVLFTRSPVPASSPFHSMPQLSDCNRSKLKLFVEMRSYPLREVKTSLSP